MLIKALFASAFFVSASGALSQETVSAGKASGAVITGVAVDSVHRTPLIGALVSVSGTALTSTTDYAGEFRIAGIPSGPHFLSLRHPLLDSLAISITTTQKDFTDGDSSFVVVGVPSPEALVTSTCSDEDRLSGPAFVVGTVTDGDTGNPSVGASVVVRWANYEIGTKSIKVTPRVKATQVSENGRFRICGLPRDLVASVFAERGGDSTAALRTDLSSLIGVLSFRLPPPKVVNGGSGIRHLGFSHLTSGVFWLFADEMEGSTATISGRVFDAQGNAASTASVSIDADDAASLTDRNGSFILGGLRPGTRWIVVRKIGYEPKRFAVDLKAGTSTSLSLALGNPVTLLRDVVVTAKRDAGLRTVGFADRQQFETGDFIGPNDLEHKDRHNLAQILETSSRYKRGGCTRFYVDGFLVINGVDPAEYLGGAEIGAIEIYSESFVPGDFLARLPNGKACKAVLVWSRLKLGI